MELPIENFIHRHKPVPTRYAEEEHYRAKQKKLQFLLFHNFSFYSKKILINISPASSIVKEN